MGYKILDCVTPSIGIGYYYGKDYIAYGNDETGKTPVSKYSGIAPFFGIEVRRTWFFFGASYCKQPFYSAGFKFHKKFKK